MNEKTESQRGPVLFLRPKATSFILTFQLGGVLETTKMYSSAELVKTALDVAGLSRS